MVDCLAHGFICTLQGSGIIEVSNASSGEAPSLGDFFVGDSIHVRLDLVNGELSFYRSSDDTGDVDTFLARETTISDEIEKQITSVYCFLGY